MGSFCELKFYAIPVLSNKSFVPDPFVALFQESDRRSPSRDAADDDVRVEYAATRDTVRHRLDLLGYTSEAARRHFEDWLAQERSTWAEYEEEGGGEWASDTLAAAQRLNYEEWQQRARDVLVTPYDFSRPHGVYKDEIDRQMRDASDGWLFYSDDVLPIIRSLLEAFPEILEVSLDISDLVGGGYIEPEEKICADRRATEYLWRSDLQPVVILAEGSTDIGVLKRSLERLYPHLADYFSFFDYDGFKVDGGASYLVKFLRAFAAARINVKILAIFDNDAAGVEAFNQASRSALPGNIALMRLPEIDLARSYPTI